MSRWRERLIAIAAVLFAATGAQAQRADGLAGQVLRDNPVFVAEERVKPGDVGCSDLTAAGLRRLVGGGARVVRYADLARCPAPLARLAEVQRAGVLIDLAGVDEDSMKVVLRAATKPLIITASTTPGLEPLSDVVLQLLQANGGVVFADIDAAAVSAEVRKWLAWRNEQMEAVLATHDDPVGRLHYAEWLRANPLPAVSLERRADEIERLIDRAGIDHVALGGRLTESDIDPDPAVTYRALCAELAQRGRTRADLAKLASGNALRVVGAVTGR